MTEKILTIDWNFMFPGQLLSDEEKNDIKKKAEIKRKELERRNNIKNADIITGKQKTQDTCWE